ncbi:peptidase S53 [Frondihabitans sp. PAMC 28766]|uniref:S53 family peptidase n=1 Tax=Frondihabitans sp. PAMC 28766 TaxID=1795630 RepID=UPI00078D1EC7|nr:S53 family peptidase [Frondihabitans sp. PAMC 28766]AMM21928.1 peptidase S53 [Frondihabitans sp. PAMC 28766]
MTDATSPLDHLELVPLAGSEKPTAPGVQPAEAALGSDTTVQATLVLRRAAPVDAATAATTVADPDAYVRDHGAAAADLELVTSTLTGLGLTILESDAASRRVRVEAAVSLVSRVFGTSLEAVSSEAPSAGRGSAARVEHRQRSGGLSVPRALDGVVVAVLGLDDRPQARAQFRIAPAAAATTVSYTPVQLGEAYSFPAGTDGTGQTVAIVELGGGFEQTDLDTYFTQLGVGSPSVTAAGVDGANNVPGQDPNGADGEVLLDIEVVGALAPKASIVVYFAPNTDAGFVDAIAQATHAKPTPTSMSISWGQSEDAWTAQARSALDDALVDAAALGVTVTAAAGDNGSSDGATDGGNHVDFPASSPHLLACGGTSLQASGATISSETVWNDGSGRGATGGGVSDAYPLPTWQASAGVPAAASAGGGRGVPDVAGNADPATGYEVIVDGKSLVIGGTSAVAPLWAALVARLAQSIGSPLGLLQPKLYPAESAFRDITSGDNGSFSAAPGWDACTGLGSPDGTALLAALRG